MEAWETPCEVCPVCHGSGRVVCKCVPHDVDAVEELVGSIDCEKCYGDGDYQCITCSGSGAIQSCSCDAAGESPCPAHWYERQLERKIHKLEDKISEYGSILGGTSNGTPINAFTLRLARDVILAVLETVSKEVKDE